MNKVEISLVHGERQKVRHGLAKQSCTFALGAGLLWAAGVPVTAKADSAAVTQLQYLQWVAQLTGASGQFNKDSSASDYLNWARGIGFKGNGEWKPNDNLDRDTLAQSLCNLFNIKVKGSSDAPRALQAAGINLSGVAGNVTKADLVALVDQITVSARLGALANSSSKKGTSDRPDDPKHSDDDDKPRGGGDPDKDHKIKICHKGITLTIDQHALQAHLNHGDTIGPCHVTRHHHDRDDD